jgi:DNA-damage-inducible protein J
MAIKTANVLARVEPSVKAKAEEILEKLGIPVSTAINMLYKQIIITQSLPFKLSLNNRPKARDEMTDEEFNSMLKLSLKQAKENKGYDLDEAFDMIEKNA